MYTLAYIHVQIITFLYSVHIRQKNSPQIAPPRIVVIPATSLRLTDCRLWTTQMSNSDEPLLGPGHAGYQCLGCKRTWSSLFALGQHTGSPYMRGTKCGVQSSIVQLRNVPRADLATGLIQAVQLYPAGAQEVEIKRQ